MGESLHKSSTHRGVQQADAYFQSKQTLTSQLPLKGTIVYDSAFRHFQCDSPECRAFSLPTLSRSDPTVVRPNNSTEDGLEKAWEEVSEIISVPPNAKAPWTQIDLSLDRNE